MNFEQKISDTSEDKEYPKLVRDRIPEVIAESAGREVATRALELEEFIEYLKKKAVEEAIELADSSTDAHLLEEITDMREVLDTLEEAKGFTAEEVRAVQNKKRAERGGFDSRLLMLHNEIV